MRKYFKYLAVFTAVIMFNCEADDETKLDNFVGFQITPVTLELPNNAAASIDIDVYASEVSSSDRSYTLTVDEDASEVEAAYTVPGSVTIPANTNKGTFTVSVTDDETIAFVKQKLVINFESVEGKYFSKPAVVNVVEECLDTLVRLNLEFDQYPDEASWALYDLSGDPTVIYEGGPYGFVEYVEASISVDFCLPSGTYGIAVFDSYGDGGTTYSVASVDGSTTYVAETTLGGPDSTGIFTIE